MRPETELLKSRYRLMVSNSHLRPEGEHTQPNRQAKKEQTQGVTCTFQVCADRWTDKDLGSRDWLALNSAF